jgi:hypothetical protein
MSPELTIRVRDSLGLEARRTVSVPVETGAPVVRWSTLGLTRTSSYVIPSGVTVLQDVDDAEVGRLQVLGVLRADRTRPTRLRLYGNLVVTEGGVVDYGTPEDPVLVDCRLWWPVVDESRIVGGGMTVLETDPGLWVMHHGRLQTHGARTTPWTRATSGLVAGQSEFTVEDASGWRAGDELAIAPTNPPTTPSYWMQTERRIIASVSGNVVRLTLPLSVAHPAVVTPWATYTAEVANLTRTVKIGGTPTGRAHIFIHAHHPQAIHYAELHHLGPLGTGRGRYALHYHHNFDGTDGTVEEGVVAHDIGSNAFVPHLSSGITFRQFVAAFIKDNAFWFDPRRTNPNEAFMDWGRVTYDRCLSIQVGDGGNDDHYFLGAGVGNRCLDCVAVGGEAKGFNWPEDESLGSQPGQGVWEFRHGLAHNVRFLGLRSWQNDPWLHTIDGFDGYYCREQGREPFAVELGAYTLRYQMHRLRLWWPSGIKTHAVGIDHYHHEQDGRGVEDFALWARDDQAFSEHVPRLIVAPVWRNYRVAGLGVLRTTDGQGRLQAVKYELRNPQTPGTPTPVWFADDCHPDCEVLLVRDGQPTLRLRRRDQPGTYDPRFNASVTVL